MSTGNDIAPDAALLPVHMDALLATTPPHIKLTRTTLANGVKRLTHRQTFGVVSFISTPSATGASTTLAQATHSDIPLTGTALPTINFVSSGVTAEARMVLAAVSKTLSATSAPAISETKLLAVPPY